MLAPPGANVRELVEVVQRRRIEPDVLLSGLPVSLATLSLPETRIPLDVCEEIISRAIEVTQETRTRSM